MLFKSDLSRTTFIIKYKSGLITDVVDEKIPRGPHHAGQEEELEII